jgi:hypothetical protein
MPCALLASFAQALLERGHEVCKLAGQFAAEKRNHRHRRLLRARRERARSTRALLNSQESNLRGQDTGAFRGPTLREPLSY